MCRSPELYEGLDVTIDVGQDDAKTEILESAMTVLKATTDLVKLCAQKIGIYISSYPPPHSFGHQLRDFLSQMEINVVLDVGAFVGNYATTLREAGYRGRIISFEPVPASYDRLHARMHHDSLWCGQPFGLSDENRRRS